MQLNYIFGHTFQCTEVDPDGKQFDDVSRIKAVSPENDYNLVLDYNCAIYEIKKGQMFQISITAHLSGEESNSRDEHWHPSMLENSTIAASYEYIMHGKVYEYEETGDRQFKATVYISFGGLLMSLTGDKNTIADIQKGKEVYLLIKRMSNK